MRDRIRLISLCLWGIIVLTVHTSSVTRATQPQKGFCIDTKRAYSFSLPTKTFSIKSFSVAAWIKTDNPAVSQGIIDVDLPSRVFTFYLYNNAVRMLVEKNASGGEYSFALAPAPLKGVWTHYCGVYDGKRIKIYCNGELKSCTEMETNLSPDILGGKLLQIGSVAPYVSRPFLGELNDVTIWDKVLSDDEVREVFQGEEQYVPIASWNVDSMNNDDKVLKDIGGNAAYNAFLSENNFLLNQKDTGYRGIWYFNEKLNNEYVYKYSGGLGTYPANHYPFSVYRPEVDKTFFCYGGFDPLEQTLWHEVGVYDHKTKKVSRPTIVLDKQTNDAHDNPIISVDDYGFIWIFSTSHGTGRPSYIHKSTRPYDISEFESIDATKQIDDVSVPMNNFSYVQMWNVPQRGFISLFTTYDRSLVAEINPNSQAQRLLAIMTSSNGVEWSAWKPVAAIEMGHYQNACVYYDVNKKADDGKTFVKIGTSFNYHPAEAKGSRGTGLNWRTNLYYMESLDMGNTWQNVQGETITIPLLESSNPALVRNYEKENRNVYITDLTYDRNGYPVIAYVTSKGFESGPEMGPRYFCVAHWNGDTWEYSTLCTVDNNYEYAMFYPEELDKDVLRLVGSFDDGPQAYNTGGEISQWVSIDSGKTWEKEYQLTQNSAINQYFPRRPINANTDFYSFWASGNGRQKSISTLYFSTKEGEVYALPREMQEDWETPILIRKAEKERL